MTRLPFGVSLGSSCVSSDSIEKAIGLTRSFGSAECCPSQISKGSCTARYCLSPFNGLDLSLLYDGFAAEDSKALRDRHFDDLDAPIIIATAESGILINVYRATVLPLQFF